MSDDHKREVDAVTGVETTGHVWDGDLKELNKPLPKWWIYTFYASIIWSIGYWIVYPAWPTMAGYTKGIWNYSQRATVMKDVETARAAQGVYRTKLQTASLADIGKDQDLLRFATEAGRSAFKNNCAPCHGGGAQGATGYPNLLDDDWLWGGTTADIEKTILYGIRSGHKQERATAMPRFGLDKLLSDQQIDQVAEYVLSLSKKSTNAAAAAEGAKVYKEQCTTCHGPEGKGMQEQGAPNLTDDIWLYGSSKAAVVESIRTGRGGVMPYWAGRLDPVTIKSLAVYVHGLGGGK